MPRDAKIVGVFIASPGDVMEEREIVERATRELNTAWGRVLGIYLEPVRWETHAAPGVGTDAQAVINEWIGDDYDIFVGILATRFGTPTERAPLGTVEEFNRAYERWKANPNSVSIMFYFKDPQVHLSRVNLDQYEQIQEFRRQLGSQGILWWPYRDNEEFTGLVRMHLSREVQRWGKDLNRQVTDSALAVVGDALEQAVNVVIADDVQTEEEQEGFFDLVDGATQAFLSSNKVSNRMADHLEELGVVVRARTAEIEAAQDESGKAPPDVIRCNADAVAEQLNLYVDQMNAELPMFVEQYKAAVKNVSRAVVVYQDFDVEDTREIAEMLEAIKSLRSSLGEAREGARTFRNAVANTPRLTTALLHAKARTLAFFEKYDEEMESAMSLTGEVERVCRDILRSRADDSA
jgi:hypothetical protein